MSIKRYYLLISGLIIFNVSQAEIYRCPDHDWFLDREDVGFEHVHHIVTLNGQIVIKELEDAMWYIEDVKCSPEGFVIDASHIQYGDPSTETFTLTVKDECNYELR